MYEDWNSQHRKKTGVNFIYNKDHFYAIGYVQLVKSKYEKRHYSPGASCRHIFYVTSHKKIYLVIFHKENHEYEQIV